MNKLFLVSFITLDGNKNQVTVDARSENHANRVFSDSYCYDEILSITEIE